MEVTDVRIEQRRSINGTPDELDAYQRLHPDFFGPLTDVVIQPGVKQHTNTTTQDEPRAALDAWFDDGVGICKNLFQRWPTCPKQFVELGRVTLERGAERGLRPAEDVAVALEVDADKLSTRLGPLGRRINGTPGGKEWSARNRKPPLLLFYGSEHRPDGWVYVPTNELLVALRQLADEGFFDKDTK